MQFPRTLAAILASGAILTTGSAALARPEPGDRLERLSQELNLTPEQETQIRGIFQSARAASEDDHQALKAARAELRTLFENDASDAALRTQHDRVQDLRSELSDLRFESMLEVREVLTPEQRDRALELRAERHEGRRGRNRGSAF